MKTRAERRETHRAKMRRKRELRALQTTGFTPVPNARINQAVNTTFAAIMMANAEAVAKSGATPLEPLAARDEAIRQVRRQLPRPPMVFDWANGLPTKNDDPEYRR